MEKMGGYCLNHGLECHAVASSKLTAENKNCSHHNSDEFVGQKWLPVAESNCCPVWAAANTACLPLARWS